MQQRFCSLQSHRATENKLTAAVSVGELEAVDAQRHSEVHRPPRVRCLLGVHTRPISHVSAMTAVIRVHMVLDAIWIGVSADLGCRTF